MRTLLLMRHAKSDWSADYGADHDRPLNERGVRSAEVMGPLLADRGLAPQLIVSSTAVRARRTAEIANESGHWRAELRLDPALYGSGTEETIDVIASAPSVERLMLVGHQPTWSIVASMLTRDPVDMKTGTVAVIGFDSEEWSAIPEATGRLLGVFQPRDHLS